MLQRRQFNALGLGALALPAGLFTAASAKAASVGQPAPDFTLTDTAGKAVKLADFHGKPVVLEWNNPGCPFVRKHYNGNMQALQKEFTGKGVVWLAINSTEEDSVDYLSPAQLARWMTDKGASPTATLMDEDGQVGQAYCGPRHAAHVHHQRPGRAGLRRRHRQHPFGPRGRHRQGHQLRAPGPERAARRQTPEHPHQPALRLQHQVQERRRLRRRPGGRLQPDCPGDPSRDRVIDSLHQRWADATAPGHLTRSGLLRW